ncbi:histidine phosphatase family protein [Kordiimonas sp. SCSIO 12610]|uniref:histidine phosphatase family protein n=1 Tax=Kordiimonas sp. SCSIO 12610 TaxID=2829597 RepID=UPI00210B33FA|nr:histidine phosphatase family protein [Kordiimonas sp. SCSIO 12610]UTW55120.1 histidine phosphatase family protein [Kordiimonas sp. SCSIO 12610]
MSFIRNISLALSVFSVSLLFIATTTEAQHTIYLVRHAEKQTGYSDPSLTDQGKVRAEALAEYLKDKNITAVFSSDYKRTLETAAPSAEQAGVAIRKYDPRELAQMKGQLSLLKGATLVVGHSNTTPKLFNLLTGLEYSDLEEHQYDHIYIVKTIVGGEVSHGIQYLEPRTP